MGILDTSRIFYIYHILLSMFHINRVIFFCFVKFQDNQLISIFGKKKIIYLTLFFLTLFFIHLTHYCYYYYYEWTTNLGPMYWGSNARHPYVLKISPHTSMYTLNIIWRTFSLFTDFWTLFSLEFNQNATKGILAFQN